MLTKYLNKFERPLTYNLRAYKSGTLYSKKTGELETIQYGHIVIGTNDRYKIIIDTKQHTIESYCFVNCKSGHQQLTFKPIKPQLPLCYLVSQTFLFELPKIDSICENNCQKYECYVIENNTSKCICMLCHKEQEISTVAYYDYQQFIYYLKLVALCFTAIRIKMPKWLIFKIFNGFTLYPYMEVKSPPRIIFNNMPL